MFDSKHCVGGVEFSCDYIEEKFGQFVEEWAVLDLKSMEPEHLECIFPDPDKLWECFPNPVLVPLVSVRVVHDLESGEDQ